MKQYVAYCVGNFLPFSPKILSFGLTGLYFGLYFGFYILRNL